MKSCPLCSSCSPNVLRSYFIASMPGLTAFNDEEITAQDRTQAEALFGPLLQAQRAQDHLPVAAAGAIPAVAAAAAAGHGGKHLGKAVQNNLLYAMQLQAQAVSKFEIQPVSVQATAMIPPAGGDASALTQPFLAPAQHSVGSASLEAMRQSLTNSSEPTAGSSGLSQRALQRRHMYASFCAAFDEALGKIVLESVLEMRTISPS